MSLASFLSRITPSAGTFLAFLAPTSRRRKQMKPGSQTSRVRGKTHRLRSGLRSSSCFGRPSRADDGGRLRRPPHQARGGAGRQEVHLLNGRDVRRATERSHLPAAQLGQSPDVTSNLMYRAVSIHQARDVSPAVSYTGPVSNLVSLIHQKRDVSAVSRADTSSF